MALNLPAGEVENVSNATVNGVQNEYSNKEEEAVQPVFFITSNRHIRHFRILSEFVLSLFMYFIPYEHHIIMHNKGSAESQWWGFVCLSLESLE